MQVALALVLLVGSGLMIRTFLALQRLPPDCAAADVLSPAAGNGIGSAAFSSRCRWPWRWFYWLAPD